MPVPACGWLRSARLLQSLGCAGLLSCAHGEPSRLAGPSVNPPQFDGGLQRLTFGAAGDWAVRWLPGDSALMYSWRDPARRDGDRCLAFQPIPGYRITREVCSRGPLFDSETTQVVLAAAVSAGGRLAFVEQHGAVGRGVAHRGLFVGRLNDSTPAVEVTSLPRTVPGALLHPNMEQLIWSDESTLVYVASAISRAAVDLRSVPLEIGRVLFRGGAVSVAGVPGTAGASSLSIDATTGTAYATFANDSRVYSLNLETGQRTVAVDLTAFGIPRDVQVANGYLVAVCRGRTFPVDPGAYGVASFEDDGGDLLFVELGAAGAPTVLARNLILWKRPALSSDGSRVVAEGYPYTLVALCTVCPGPVLYDTVVTYATDLWLIPRP